MNRREAVHGAGAFAGPAALVVGGSMLTLALTGVGSYRPEAAAPPAPTATATVTAPPASTTRTAPTRPHTSTPAPRTAPTGEQIVAASAPRAGSSSPRQPSGIAPSGPVPHPTATPPSTTSRCAVGVTALTLNACLHLGGTR